MPDRLVAIDVQHLSHSFGEHRALVDVNFQVHAGSLHGFVGPNGAGKTTTLKVICTLLKPDRGRVRVFSHNVVADARAVRKRIGFMPDHFSMYRQMTVGEYLDFFGAAYGLSTADRNRVINDVLVLTDMEGRRDHLISGLSRGMQQRVSLARVLVNDPDLLLLDEPASGLDPRARIELMEILRELRRMGKTVFISSHILSELAELCDSVTIIDRGTIKFSGSMDELALGADAHPTWVLLLATPDDSAAERLRAIAGVLEVLPRNDRPEYRITVETNNGGNALLKGILDAGLAVAAFSAGRRHLNEAFLDLTEQGVR
ncbi:MAG: ABC transporter ATP-binding protein [Planctomycetes bacterium]|nr:ABC transporter ATP-binding protein [Planctomycetota bacterium]